VIINLIAMASDAARLKTVDSVIRGYHVYNQLFVERSYSVNMSQEMKKIILQ